MFLWKMRIDSHRFQGKPRITAHAFYHPNKFATVAREKQLIQLFSNLREFKFVIISRFNKTIIPLKIIYSVIKILLQYKNAIQRIFSISFTFIY